MIRRLVARHPIPRLPSHPQSGSRPSGLHEIVATRRRLRVPPASVGSVVSAPHLAAALADLDRSHGLRLAAPFVAVGSGGRGGWFGAASLMRRRRAVAIDIWLHPWSIEETELHLAPRSPGVVRWGARRFESYCAHAHASTNVLVVVLEDVHRSLAAASESAPDDGSPPTAPTPADG